MALPRLRELLPRNLRDALAWHARRARLVVWAVGALAEGLDIRAVARVFEVDPNTVLRWVVEAADQATAFSQSFLHDVHVDQVQLDELFARLSAVKTGQMSEAEALTHLSCSSHWVWGAIDPCDTQIKDLPIFPYDKPTHQTSHSAKIILDVSALRDDPMYTPVTFHRMLPAIAFNTAKMLIG